jgi:hypothetical protein
VLIPRHGSVPAGTSPARDDGGFKAEGVVHTRRVGDEHRFGVPGRARQGETRMRAVLVDVTRGQITRFFTIGLVASCRDVTWMSIGTR